MLKKATSLSAAAALLLLVSGANADVTGSVSYSHLSISDGGLDVDVGAIVGSVGYQFEVGDNFFLVPEVRVGFGIVDDTVMGVKVDLDRLWGIANRFQYDFDGGAYLFGVLSYVNYKFKARGPGGSASDDTWETGFGAGAGYMFTDLIGGEVSYESVDSEDLWTFGLRLRF